MQEWRITRHTPAMVRNAQWATSEYQKKTSATGVENHQTGKGFGKKKRHEQPASNIIKQTSAPKKEASRPYALYSYVKMILPKMLK